MPSSLAWQTTFDAIGDLVMILDRERRIVKANRAVADFFGVRPDELPGMKCFELVHGTDAPPPACPMEALIGSRTRQRAEVYEPRRDLWLEASTDPLYDEDGNLAGIVHVIRNITHAKQVEQALRDSEEKFRTIFDRATDGILIADAETRKFLSGNKAICAMLGYAREEIEGLGVEDIHPQESLSSVIEHFERQARELGVAPDVPVRRKDGSVFFADINSSLVTLSGKKYLVGIFRDITGRKEAERTVRESEERFRIVADQTGQLIYDYDVASGKIAWDGAIQSLTGFSREEFQGVDIGRWSEMIHEEDRQRALDALDAAGAAVSSYDIDYRFLHKDGTYRLMHDAGMFLPGPEGQAARMLGAMQDITASRNAERALRESEERFRSFITLLPQTVYEADVAGNLTFVNKAATEIFGYSPEEYRGMSIANLICEEDAACARDQIGRVLAGETVAAHEYRVKRKDGSEAYALVQSGAIRDADGNVTGLRGIVIDITERKEAERKLRENEALLASTLESTADGILVVSGEGRVMLANGRFADMWNIPEGMIARGDDQELLRYVLSQLADPQAFLDKVHRLYASREVDFDTIPFRDGRVFERVSAPLIVGDVASGRVWSFRDVTARMQAEEALRVEHERLLSIFDSIGEAIYVADVDTYEVLYANRALKELLGRDPVGEPCYCVLQNCKEPCAFCSNPILRQLKGRSYRWEYHNPLLERDFVLFDRLIRWPDGRDVRFEMAIDITDRKLAEASLKDSEARYRNLFEAANDAIFVIEAGSGRILEANSRCAALTGKAVASLIGMDHAELYPEEDRQQFTRLYDRPAGSAGGFTRLVHVEHADGYEIPVQISARYMHIKDTPAYLAIYRDITELKVIERAMSADQGGLAKLVSERTMELGRALKDLENARRLADIGTLAATVAHELRNPLGVISTALYNIKAKSADDRLDKHIASIEKKVIESDRIINNLLSYASVKAPVFGEVTLSSVFEEALEHISTKYTESAVKVERDYKCPAGVLIRADREQISELVTNLLDNAYQALSAVDRERKIAVGCERLEGRAHLWVEDNGEGMTKTQQERAFEPFFSSRARGIGLGLPLCKQIVSLHDGEIAISSEPGKGTRVDVYVPFR